MYLTKPVYNNILIVMRYKVRASVIPRSHHFLVLMALFVSLAGLVPASGISFAADDSSPASVVVRMRQVDLSLPAEAAVEAVRQAVVAAEVAGRVIVLRVDAGQRVKAGELLLRLDARAAAGSDLAAQAALTQSRAAYERAKSLHARKFISQAALDQAEAAWKGAQGSAGAAGAALSHAAVTAPISGVVALRQVELGEMAEPGKPLLTVFDPASLRVVASVPQSALAGIRKGGHAQIEFQESGRRIDAVRIEVLPTVDVKSHNGTVRVYLPAGAEGVMPGMAARVHFMTGKGPKLTVPPTAVLRRGEVTAVYVLTEKNAPRLRQVRLGEPGVDGEIEVLAGLTAGERVSLEPVKTGVNLKTAGAHRD
jgi:RND family efflux transporter MFP subunit